MNTPSESNIELGNQCTRAVPKKPRTRREYVVWTLGLESDAPRAPAVWGTDGVVMTERKAVQCASAHKCSGTPALALPLGREPKDLHPAERPILVRG